MIKINLNFGGYNIGKIINYASEIEDSEEKSNSESLEKDDDYFTPEENNANEDDGEYQEENEVNQDFCFYCKGIIIIIVTILMNNVLKSIEVKFCMTSIDFKTFFINIFH